MFRENLLKRRLLAGEAAFGASMTLGSSAIAELMGACGCDFVLLDAEHGLGDERCLLHSLQALAGTPAHGVLRLASDDRTLIKRALDMGAEAIMVPAVSTTAAAKAVVDACRYPPRGTRGYAASGVRASDYGRSAARYLGEHEQELLIAVMIETAQGVDQAEAIAAVEGIDVVQIGANDLAYDLGLGERLQDIRLIDAIRHVEAAARRAGKVLGGAPLPGDSVPAMRARGYGLFTLGRDAGLLARQLGDVLAAGRSALDRPSS